MTERIYFISGLGADKRAFKKLFFPSHFELIYLDWIPALKNESLKEYASRMALLIDNSASFFLVGLSFGGMLAVEIAKTLKPVHTILISSTPVFTELPWYFRIAGKLRLQKFIPVNLLKRGNSIGLKFLGAKTYDEKVLLKQLVNDCDPSFMKWAITCILTWKNTERPLNLTHIHGNADNILPLRYNNPDVIIAGGGHFMVYANAKEISEIIQDKFNIH